MGNFAVTADELFRWVLGEGFVFVNKEFIFRDNVVRNVSAG